MRIWRFNSLLHLSGTAGFTLLEITLAITIIAIIFSIIFPTFFVSLTTKEKVEKLDEIYHTGRTILLRLSTELNSSFLASPARSLSTPPQTRGIPKPADSITRTIFRGEDRREYDRDLDRLVFFHLSHFLFFPLNLDEENLQPESEISETEYFGRIDYEKDVTYLVRRENLLFQWPSPSESGASYALTDNLKFFNIRYYHQKKTLGKWYDEWDSSETIRTPGGLPFAVEIEFSITDSEKREYFFSTIVDIPPAWK